MGAHLPLLLTGLSGRLLILGRCLFYVRCPLLLSPDHRSALLDEDLESVWFIASKPTRIHPGLLKCSLCITVSFSRGSMNSITVVPSELKVSLKMLLI